MVKGIVSRITVFIAALMSFLIAFSSSAIAVGNSSEAGSIKSIKITSQHGVVQGQSVQLSAITEPDNALFGSVEWFSSNPSVIECTKDGKIKGISAGDYAYITCKAKYGNASATITVYCVESIDSYYKSGFVNSFTFILAEPNSLIPSVLHFQNAYVQAFLTFLSMMKWIASSTMSYNNYFPESRVIFDAKCEVRGKYDSYAYIVFKRDNGYIDGFVRYSRLEDNPSGDFLEISSNDMDVWGHGYANTDKKLTTNYNGTVKWTVSDTDIISFNENTGQVIGKKPGVATITATADGMSQTCVVHSLYRWPQITGATTPERKREWVTQTNCDTHLYSAKGSAYNTTREIKSGTSFTVWGDSGKNDQWAYGNITGTNYWGYVRIGDISTKGTISQYRSLGWSWPVKTESGKSKANYISSPYGWRELKENEIDMHKGMDITTGEPSEIKGYEVVSAFKGQVAYLCTISSNDTGYCVGVRSEETDPVSGKNFIAFYMHLNEKPDFRRGDDVSQEEILGFVGNTGNSTGAHLHFEANNQNASIGDDARNYYAYLINPIFFYLKPINDCIIGNKEDKKDNDDKIIIDSGTSGVSKYNGAYWYGDDREDNKP